MAGPLSRPGGLWFLTNEPVSWLPPEKSCKEVFGHLTWLLRERCYKDSTGIASRSKRTALEWSLEAQERLRPMASPASLRLISLK